MAFDAELAGRIRAALSFQPGVTERRMFGGCAFLLDGKMFGAASGHGLMLRIDPSVAGSLIDGDGVRPLVMNGREFGGWLYVDDVRLETESALRGWLDHGLAFVRTLPAK